MFRAAPGNVPPPLSVIRERLRAATGELQLVCNDSGVCPCDGFYGASSPCALSFSASRCFSGSVMMPTPFPLRSKTWFPTWKGCWSLSPEHAVDEFKQDEEEEVQKEDGEEEDAKEADVYEANPRYTIEQDPEQGEVLRSEIQKGDTAGKILGDWMDANDLAELLAAAKPVYALTKVRFGQPFAVVRIRRPRRSGVSSTKSIRKNTSSSRRRTTVSSPGLKKSTTRPRWRSSKERSRARFPEP